MLRQLLILFILFFNLTVFSQDSNQVIVDQHGVMRWETTQKEVFGFGVNYSLPFAHVYRTGKKMGISIEAEIDRDVYHMARLGFDAFRIHVWDTEITDTIGNLLENEHLKMFDFLLWKLEERGIKVLLTPIAFWGNGWPEKDLPTPGFSYKYGKQDCLTNAAAIQAQENYLSQFVNHVNVYTKKAYKDDPNIIAFEISNEPHHQSSQSSESVTSYIKRMIHAIKKTGCEKPVFYNVSHSIQFADAYMNAGIEGGTFQWYPTKLMALRPIQGNFLPHVDEYVIPFKAQPAFKKIAKVIYEFDPADVMDNYLYPALARSFRTAGFQWATQFAYDPSFLAHVNSEYNTHFMNLGYTPQKALALQIAGEVFHKIDRYEAFGPYPDNLRFGPFRVDYERNLAEMVSDTQFIYSNHTSTNITNPEKLKKIYGWGNSPIVKYEGTGAYFLDQLSEGQWRLELMPDALILGNPLGANTLNNQVAAINWQSWPMKVNLPDLDSTFFIQPLNKGNNYRAQAIDHHFQIQPGTYLLSNSKELKTPSNHNLGPIGINEFGGLEQNLKEIHVIHTPPKTIPNNNQYKIEATIIAPDPPTSVTAYYWGLRLQNGAIPLKKLNGYQYEGWISDTLKGNGILKYIITVATEKDTIHFPNESQNDLEDWNYPGANPYSVQVKPDVTPISLFTPIEDAPNLHHYSLATERIGFDTLGEAYYSFFVFSFTASDMYLQLGQSDIYDYSTRLYIGDKLAPFKKQLPSKSKLVFKGGSWFDKPCPIQLAFVLKDGSTYGAVLEIQPTEKEHELPLNQLKPVKLALLPRPYPGFQPYFFEHPSPSSFDINQVESLQISLGPGISNPDVIESHGVFIKGVWLR